MFGVTPSYGFYIRHARGITFDNVEVSYGSDDARPAFVLDDVKNIEFFRTNAQLSSGVKMFSLKNVSSFTSTQSRTITDIKVERTDQKQF